MKRHPAIDPQFLPLLEEIKSCVKRLKRHAEEMYRSLVQKYLASKNLVNVESFLRLVKAAGLRKQRITEIKAIITHDDLAQRFLAGLSVDAALAEAWAKTPAPTAPEPTPEEQAAAEAQALARKARDQIIAAAIRFFEIMKAKNLTTFDAGHYQITILPPGEPRG